MTSYDYRMALEPQIVLVDQLLDQVEQGRIRVPRFQRPFVWRQSQIRDLFDSIEKGYPIGTLLLWQPHRAVPTLPEIGGMPVPKGDADYPITYVLDGHQRLSTLFGVLRRSPEFQRPCDGDQKWRVYRALNDDREPYRHHRRATDPPLDYLPLHAVSRTMDFLQFSRGLEVSPLQRDELRELIRRAETIAHKIKNYQLTLVRLVDATLDQAIEVYTRLNRTGRKIAPDQLVSALTYQLDGRPPLDDHIDGIIAEVASTGFGEISRTAVFRTILSVAGETDVMSASWEAVSDRLARRLHDAAPAARRAIQAAVGFLREEIGLPLAKFLPYPNQLMLFAVFFHHCPEPTAQQREELRRWFWISSWTARFSNASHAQIRHAIDSMKRCAAGDGLTIETDGVQLTPDRFDLNHPRTRAYVTWELRTFPNRKDPAGNPMNLISYLASATTRVYRPVVEGDQHPANQLILPTPTSKSVRNTLVEIWAQDPRSVLESHGIPVSAWERLREGNGEEFVRTRAEYLERRLREFADGLGIPVPHPPVSAG